MRQELLLDDAVPGDVAAAGAAFDHVPVSGRPTAVGLCNVGRSRPGVGAAHKGHVTAGHFLAEQSKRQFPSV